MNGRPIARSPAKRSSNSRSKSEKVAQSTSSIGHSTPHLCVKEFPAEIPPGRAAIPTWPSPRPGNWCYVLDAGRRW